MHAAGLGECQFFRSLRRPHDCLDEGYAQFAFFQFHDAVNGAARRGGYSILEQSRMVAGFEHENDARRFWDAMRERLQEFVLTLHPEKTRLLKFGRYAAAARKRLGLSKPETFAFLGFIFISGKSRGGAFLVHRKTRRDRMSAKLKEIKEELQRRMHRPIPEQGAWLRQVVTGFFAYHAVPTNFRALLVFHAHVKGLWYRTLRRRSQKDRTTWDRMLKLADEFLPQPRILHPWPNQRFDVNHPR